MSCQKCVMTLDRARQISKLTLKKKIELLSIKEIVKRC